MHGVLRLFGDGSIKSVQGAGSYVTASACQLTLNREDTKYKDLRGGGRGGNRRITLKDDFIQIRQEESD